MARRMCTLAGLVILAGCNINIGGQQSITYDLSVSPTNDEVAYTEDPDGNIILVDTGQLSGTTSYTAFQIIDLLYHAGKYDWNHDYIIELLLKNSGTEPITEIELICNTDWGSTNSYDTLIINDTIEPGHLYTWQSPDGSAYDETSLTKPGEIDPETVPESIEILQVEVNGNLLDLPTKFLFESS